MTVVRMSRRRVLAAMASTFAVSCATVASAQSTTIDTGRLNVPNDGVTDATAALKAAAKAVPDAGGTLRLAPGRYLVSETIFIKGGTTATGDRATLVAHRNFRPTPERLTPSGRSMMLLANVGHGGDRICDERISVVGVAFDLDAVRRGDFHAISIRKARGVRVLHCNFKGGGDATAFLACEDTEVAFCHAVGTINCAYDHWEGTSDALVHDCFVDCAGGYGILFTGAGTVPGDNETARNLVARHNVISGSREAGIWICSLSQRSLVEKVSVTDNHVFNLRAGSGIGATGNCVGVLI